MRDAPSTMNVFCIPKTDCCRVAGALVLWLAMISCGRAGKFNSMLDVGDPAPVWKNLPGIDGKTHSLADYKSEVLVVCFTCNHCPVATGYQARIQKFTQEFGPRGVEFIAINVNRGRGETLEKMQQRAKKAGWKFPCLKDDSQQTARLYGARTTPAFFVLNADRKIVYLGAFDDNREAEQAVEQHYVIDAVQAALDGKRPEVAETRSTGCQILLDDEE